MSYPFTFLLIGLFGLIHGLKDTINDFPVTFYGSLQRTAQTTAVDYYAITQCDKATASGNKAVLSLLLQNNPSWRQNIPFIYVELSTCAGKFTSQCVFATNYVYSSTSLVLYNNITWAYNNKTLNTTQIYMRIRGQLGLAPYNFELTYTNSAAVPFTSGVYNANVFTGNTVTQAPYPISQIARSTVVYKVQNEDTQTFFLDFCPQDITKAYSVTVTVVADPEKPLSAFNLYLCPGSDVSCDIIHAEIEVQIAAAVVSYTVTSDNSNFDLSEGLWIVVYGAGGDYNGTNNFILSASLNQ